ncbi:hypothetical protein IW140_005343 [Coemansia sp. RSA 1813]|nr:hypothetical protein IW140_005343 [Coemansia sp. RSA 1813]
MKDMRTTKVPLQAVGWNEEYKATLEALVLDIALETRQRKHTIQRESRGREKKARIQAEISRPKHQVQDAIRTGSHDIRGLLPSAITAIRRLTPILSSYPTDYEFEKDNIYYDVKAHPEMHAKAFFRIAQLLETEGERVFQCMPLRMTWVSQHITIDTGILRQNILQDQTYRSTQDTKENIWWQVLDLNSKAIVSQNGYNFIYTVQTDGVSISIIKEKEGGGWKPKRKKGSEFKYVSELGKNKLNEIADRSAYFDPNRHDLEHGILPGSTAEDPKSAYRDGIVLEAEEHLQQVSCMTTNPTEYKRYLRKRTAVHNVLSEFYTETLTNRKEFGQYLHRRLRLSTYMNQLAADQRLANYIRKKAGRNDLVLVIGNWQATMVRFQEPIRGIGMLLYTINEFRTSTFCPSCGGILRKCLRVQNPRKKPRKKRPFVVCHGLLECTSDECIQYVKEKLREKNGNESGAGDDPGATVEGRYWNRDTAAALNFKIITDSLRTVGRVPERFDRNVKLTPEQQRQQSQHQPLKLQVPPKLQQMGEEWQQTRQKYQQRKRKQQHQRQEQRAQHKEHEEQHLLKNQQRLEELREAQRNKRMDEQEQRERDLNTRVAEFKEHRRQLEQKRRQKHELQQQQQIQLQTQAHRSTTHAAVATTTAALSAAVAQQQLQTRRQIRCLGAPSVPSADSVQPGRHRSKRKAATASTSAAAAPEQEQIAKRKRADWQ